ncbi:helix-turn-helix domain-containing protein [Spongiactinospora sp. TRM90649]|uniref:ArsR/SmtB family transcription factor n=1 Tax=Spongiactinospora sp. TRM90649 TaxID=3031114 RepID=UPI0023F79216|nr:helix-turn-helix domain-containing protein [Spongiactinospora sp. TRM90649]MDF5758160.1 helix-turn-helix domain-containing protein [Spongiactinospora sp. TRM90649]
MPEPRRAELGTIKALANPIRQRILEHLRDGPATSTTLARALGITTGGTSYNLRVLARHGLVEEVPELAHGRERWWRHVPVDLRFEPRDRRDKDMRTALAELERGFLAADLDLFDRFQRARGDMGPWGDAMPYSRGEIRVTLEELARFFEEYIELIKRYTPDPDQAPPGARLVQTRFLAFPDPGPPEDEPEE